MRILVAEDDPVSSRELGATLRHWGHEIISVSDGALAWEILKQDNRPKLAILDWCMPGLDGVDICRRARASESARSAYIILLTAKEGRDNLVAALDAGANDYLTRPFDPAELQARVRTGERMVEMQLAMAAELLERQRAEGRLRRQLDFTEAITASMGEGIYALDECGHVTFINPAAESALGWSQAELMGKPIHAAVHFHDGVGLCPPDKCQLLKSLVSGQTCHIQSDFFYRKCGTTFPVSYTASPIVTEGKAVGAVLTFQDTTERRLAEEALRESEGHLRQAQKLESIGQLAAGIAHEINTPTQYVGDNTRFLQDAFADLTPAILKYREAIEAARSGGLTTELIEEVEDAAEAADISYLIEEVPKAITQVLDGVGRITKIVKSMKDFAHPGSKEKQAADLNRALESTITVAQNEWKYVAEMVTDFDESLPLVPCLLGEFNQVILNMIVNAAHAIGDMVGDGDQGKGTITVSTKREGEWAKITIGDTGTGIPEANRLKIFDPFFTTKEVGKGTGQGLAIAHRVIEKHRGRIDVVTEEGHGTSFIINLPLE